MLGRSSVAAERLAGALDFWKQSLVHKVHCSQIIHVAQGSPVSTFGATICVFYFLCPCTVCEVVVLEKEGSQRRNNVIPVHVFNALSVVDSLNLGTDVLSDFII